MYRTDLAYRTTAAQGASGFGLLIALYDTLAGNLRRAAEAQREDDIERRCKEVNHALMVIGYLDDCLRRGPGGQLAQQLLAFYSALRRKVLDAQVKQSPELLEREMTTVLKMREYWHKVELRGPGPGPDTSEAAAIAPPPGYASTESTSRYGGWSA
jgi:flagellar secretion chaperone FliS